MHFLTYICGLSRIGTEHEKFGFELGTLRPIRYGQIVELLDGIAERFYWDKIMEGDNVIGLKQVRIVSFVLQKNVVHKFELKKFCIICSFLIKETTKSSDL